MFQRFSNKPANREKDYKFVDLKDFASDNEEEENQCTPEKYILNELNARKKVILEPLRTQPSFSSPEPKIALDEKQHTEGPAPDDFVVEFKEFTPPPEPKSEPKISPNPNLVRFALYEDSTTPKKSEQNSTSTLVSPDVRFKSNRETKTKIASSKEPLKPCIRSPLKNVNANKKENTPQDNSYELEDVEDEFDVEQLFSRIRHNRIQYVVDAFETGCDPFVTVIEMFS